MKKFIALVLAVLVVMSLSCIAVFAADEAVLRVSALKKGEGIPVLIKEYTSFEDGWNEAMELAGNVADMRKNGYDRIVVDLLASWNAVNGEFTDDWINGDGFYNDTIYIPDEAKVMINMNGHTIDRGLTRATADGEVIFINDDADVIINDGTIKGGYGDMGDAGAIYIDGNARVTLNRVDIVNNRARWNGGGISVGAGSILTVNDGSFKNNEAIDAGDLWINFGGAVYVDESTAIFNNVEFKENLAPTDTAYGAAIYAEDSKVVIDNCTFNRNGIQTAKEASSETVIHSDESKITITNTTFTDNVARDLFYMEDSILNITGGSITKTVGANIFHLEDTQANIADVTITDNTSGVMTLENSDKLVNMIGCTLGNNAPTQTEAAFVINRENTLTLLDCTLGDTTFSNKQFVKITTSEVTREEALIGIELLREDDTVDSVRYYKDFESGWNYAVECAKTGLVDHVVVSLYADWNTNEYGVVTIPSDARMTINMNGHFIDRGLGKNNQDDGEVICVDNGADLIINGGKEGDAFVKPGENTENIPMGKITGGNSDNGAGGIHIHDEARVTLNNVNIVGNTTDDDDGAGIAAYDGATLIMNGGSISNNILWSSFQSYADPYGSLYLNDSTAYLNSVEFVGNQFAGNNSAYGVAIYTAGSKLVAENCVFKENGNRDAVSQGRIPNSVISIDEGSMEFINCVFEDNGVPESEYGGEIVELWGGTVKISNSVFRNNSCDSVIDCRSGILEVSDTVFEDNYSRVFWHKADAGSFFKNCTFSGNTIDKSYKTFDFDEDNALDFENCDFGDSTFNDRSFATFDGAAGAGSIIGGGSFAVIIAFIALLASAASFTANAAGRKRGVKADN